MCALALHALLLPASGLRTVEFPRALGATACGLDRSTCVRLAAAGPTVVVLAHVGTGPGLAVSSDCSQSRERGWRPRRDCAKAHDVSQGRFNSGSHAGSAAIVAGSFRPGFKSSLRDLARLFLSLSGSRDQWDAVAGSVSAEAVSGAGSLPGSVAPGPVSAPSACSSVRVPTPGVVSLSGGASATGLSSLLGRSRESPRSERHCKCSFSGERSHSGKRRCWDRSPSPSRSSRLARLSASALSASSDAGNLERVMPPPPASHSGVGGGLSGRDRSGSGHDRSPRSGPSGLGLGSRSSPVPGQSCLGYGGRASPSPSDAGDDDRYSTVGSLNTDRNDSFRSVPHLIQEFHGLEELASVAPIRWKTSLAPVYGLQSESSPTLHLSTYPLLQSLLEDTNSTLSNFVEDQSVNGFLPVPSRWHRRYYRPSSSSFPGPYSVPPVLASVTLEHVSESQKRSISLSQGVVGG